MKGSVKKRGKSWYYTVDLPRENGKRRQKMKGGFKTKKEAEAALAEILADINRGEFIEESKMTFGELIEEWLKNLALGKRVKATTVEKYSRIYTKKIKPNSISGYKIQNLKPIHISNYYSELSKTLAGNTIRGINNVIRGALSWAEKMGMAQKNPAASVDLPKIEKRDFKVWTNEEMNRFLAEAGKHWLYGLFYLALATGMRQGELLALKWDDIDFQNGIIHVQRNWTKTGNVAILTTAKTASSRRNIKISQSVLNALQEHKKRQAARNQKESEFIFCNRKGRLFDPTNVRVMFKNIQEAANVPVIRFHDLRHTHASILLQKGVHPKIVSERLGHASVSLTLDTYSHLIPSLQESAAAAIDDYFADVGDSDVADVSKM